MKKAALIIVVVFALVARIDHKRLFMDLYTDKSCHLVATENYKNGFGHTILWPSTSNIAKTRSLPFLGYARGYNVLLSWIPCADILKVSLFVDIVALIVLQLAIFFLLYKLKASYKVTVIALLLQGFSYSIYSDLTSTDLLATSLFTLTLAVCVEIIDKKPDNLWCYILIGFMSFLPSFIKYSAYPTLIAIPASLLLIGLACRSKRITIGSFIAGAVAIIALVLSKAITQDSPIKNEIDALGFFPHQLLQFDDFPFKAFYFIKALVYAHARPTILSVYRIIALLISIILLGIIVIFIKSRCPKILKERKTTPAETYAIIGLVSTTGIMMYLVLLSLVFKGQVWKHPSWTFVEETRYYGPVMVFIQLLIVYIAFQEYAVLNKLIQQGLRIFIYGAIGFTGLYWINQNKNYYLQHKNQYTYQWNHKEEIAISHAINKSLELPSTVKKSIFISDAIETALNVSLLSKVNCASMDENYFFQHGILSSKDFNIFILVPRNKQKEAYMLLNEYKATKLDSTNKSLLYHFILHKNS